MKSAKATLARIAAPAKGCIAIRHLRIGNGPVVFGEELEKTDTQYLMSDPTEAAIATIVQ
jgi:hypothetical protein